jgi:hypothetical protein
MKHSRFPLYERAISRCIKGILQNTVAQVAMHGKCNGLDNPAEHMFDAAAERLAVHKLCSLEASALVDRRSGIRSRASLLLLLAVGGTAR